MISPPFRSVSRNQILLNGQIDISDICRSHSSTLLDVLLLLLLVLLELLLGRHEREDVLKERVGAFDEDELVVQSAGISIEDLGCSKERKELTPGPARVVVVS